MATTLTDRFAGIPASASTRGRVRAATTAAITVASGLNEGDTLDGITLVYGDLVLVKDQAAPAQNGIYRVSASPERAPDFEGFDDHPGAIMVVLEGTANAGTLWYGGGVYGGTLDTTSITFAQLIVAGFGSLTPTDNGVVIGNGSALVIESGATLRTSIGASATGETVFTGTAAAAFAAIKQDADTTTTGVVELATVAEAVTGTDTSRAVTAAGVQARLGNEPVDTDTSSGTVNNTAAMVGRHRRFSSASTINFTLLRDSSLTLNLGDWGHIQRTGSGALNFVAGTAVTINSFGTRLIVAGQYGHAWWQKTAADTYAIWGDLI